MDQYTINDYVQINIPRHSMYNGPINRHIENYDMTYYISMMNLIILITIETVQFVALPMNNSQSIIRP